MKMLRKMFVCSAALISAVSCSSELVDEAGKAERDGRVINNEIMSAMYPSTFTPGYPQYLERDFEAGADFVCDEIKEKHGHDICSETEINWR